MSATAPKVVVYQARNLVNGHCYIGFTGRGLKQREMQHRQIANGKGTKYVLHNAIRKHGQSNFVFEVLGDFGEDEELAKVFEREAIAKWRPEYNLSYGGEGGTLHESTRKKIGDANRGNKMSPETLRLMSEIKTGKKHSAETKLKISAANKGHPGYNKGVPLSEEMKRKLSAANKGQIPWTAGKKHSEETKRKMSAWQIGRKLPAETCAKISAARRNIKPTEATLATLKINQLKAMETIRLPVRCVDDGRVFLGSSDADRFYGFKIGLVSRIVKGTVKNNTGKIFVRHVEEGAR